MTHDELRDLMREARELGVTCLDLAAHPLIQGFWSYKTVSDYTCPGWRGKGPSRIFLRLAGEALADLILRAQASPRSAA